MASNNIDNAGQTYASFVSFVKWGTIVSVVLAALVVLLIST